MALIKPTYDDEVAAAQDLLQSRTGLTNFAEGSAGAAISALVAENQTRIYDLLTQAENARSIDTAAGSDLDNLARGFGLTRLAATTAGADAGTGQLLVTNNSTSQTLSFSAHTAVWNPSTPATRFYTTATVSVAPGSAVAVQVQASRPGDFSNVGVGTLTAHNSNSQFSVTNFLPVRGGSLAETDDAFRYRISQTLKAAVIGGPMSAQGVMNALLALPGILDVILQPGQGTVTAIIVPTDDYSPDDDFLTTVETEMARVCAVGVSVTAQPPKIVGIDVDIALSVSGSTLAPQAPLKALMQSVVTGYINTRRVYVQSSSTDTTETAVQYQVLQAALVNAAQATLGDRLLGVTVLLSTASGQSALQGDIYPRNGEVLRSRAVRVTTATS
jgi:uncharacterized phage protein gp47/JayE